MVSTLVSLEPLTVSKPLIYADYNNAGPGRRVRLNREGASRDLAEPGLALREGLEFILHDEELEAVGEIHYSHGERIWVARVDWESIRQTSGSPSRRPVHARFAVLSL